EPLVDIAWLRAIRGIALDIDTLDPATVDEIVDVAAAPGSRNSAVHIAGVEAECGETLLIDIELEAGDVGQLAETHLAELGIRVRCREQLIARRSKPFGRHASGILELHRKAAGLPQSADRSGDQREYLRVAKPAESTGCTLDDGIG